MSLIGHFSDVTGSASDVPSSGEADMATLRSYFRK
jgi:hypothetical protein